MTQEGARQIENYFDNGWLVIIENGYVDSPVSGIYPDEETDELVYDSEVFSMQPLSEIQIYQVTIAKPLQILDLSAFPEFIENDQDYTIQETVDA